MAMAHALTQVVTRALLHAEGALAELPRPGARHSRASFLEGRPGVSEGGGCARVTEVEGLDFVYQPEETVMILVV